MRAAPQQAWGDPSVAGAAAAAGPAPETAADVPLQHRKAAVKAALASQRVLVLEASSAPARTAMRLLRKHGAVGTLVRDTAAAMAAYRSSALAARMQPDHAFTCMVLSSSLPDVQGAVQALRALGCSAPIVQVAPPHQGQLQEAAVCVRQPLLPNKLVNALMKALA